MQTWTDISSIEKPSVANVIAKVRELFPESKELIQYVENEHIVFMKSQYQEAGFTVPVPATIKSWDFMAAIEKGLKKADIRVTRGMSFAPGSTPYQNPNADEDISAVVAYEINAFMERNKSFAYKAHKLEIGCGVRFEGTDKYASALPPKALFDDIKGAIEAEFNVAFGDLNADGEVKVSVATYALTETWRELFDRSELPEFSLVGTDPRQSDDAKRKATQNFDAFMMAQGKLTLIRHGWIAGHTSHPAMRERRIITDCGGANFEQDGSFTYSIEGCYSRADGSYRSLEARAREGRISEGEIYQECLPDVMVESLIDFLRKAHAQALGADERESAGDIITQARQAAIVHKINPLPKAVIDLQEGDRFAANGDKGCLLWCQVKERTGDVCHAWVINGHWDIVFDLNRNVNLADLEHGIAEGIVSIVFTAPCPITHDVNYNEACEFVRSSLAA
jgi:hypothetical protein